MKEIWDLYDAEGQLTGGTVTRGSSLPPGYFHLIVHIWLIAPDGRLLIQQRNKPGNESHGFWAPTAGSIVSGEDSAAGALRETGEEVGVILNADQLLFHEREFIDDFMQDVWLAPWDGDPDACIIDPEEVLAIRSVTWQDIMEMLTDGKFIPYGEEYFRRLKTALQQFQASRT